MSRLAILDLNMFAIDLISFRTQTSLTTNRVFETHSDDFIFLLVEDISQVGAKLLDFFLLFHDFLLKVSRLVL